MPVLFNFHDERVHKWMQGSLVLRLLRREAVTLRTAPWLELRGSTNSIVFE